MFQTLFQLASAVAVPLGILVGWYASSLRNRGLRRAGQAVLCLFVAALLLILGCAVWEATR